MRSFLSIGTGPGIGLATAERFAREGFRAILSARNEAKTRRLAEQLRAKGYDADVGVVDAGDPSSVAALVSMVESELSAIDVVHFNAASMRKATLSEQPRDTFNSDLGVNIGGALAAVQAASPKMLDRESGSILLTGGGFAVHPHPAYLSLSVGKAGIRAMAQAIFENFKEHGVHVAAVNVASYVPPGSSAAEAVAERFWQLHSQPTGMWDVEATYAAAV